MISCCILGKTYGPVVDIAVWSVKRKEELSYLNEETDLVVEITKRRLRWLEHAIEWTNYLISRIGEERLGDPD